MRLLPAFFVISFFFTFASTPSAAEQTATANDEAVSMLTTPGKWAGKWRNDWARGTVTFSFQVDDGVLRGRFLGSTGSSIAAAPGDLDDLKVAGDTVTFVTPLRVRYELFLKKSGGLVGKSYYPSTYSPGDIVSEVSLLPSAK